MPWRDHKKWAAIFLHLLLTQSMNNIPGGGGGGGGKLAYIKNSLNKFFSQKDFLISSYIHMYQSS